MSLHGRSAHNPESTQPLTALRPLLTAKSGWTGWAPPPSSYPGAPSGGYQGYGGTGYGGYGGGGSGRGPWQPPSGGWRPPPPDRRAAIIVVAVLAAVAVMGAGLLAIAATGLRIGRPAHPAAQTSPAGLRGSGARGSARSSPALRSPGPSPSPPQSVSTISAEVSPCVVDVDSQLASGGAAAGTGMILTPTGEILTNNHVIDGALVIRVEIAATGRIYPAVVVGTDATDDVAVLQLEYHPAGLATLPIGDSSKVAVGDPVVALGNAQGLNGRPAVVDGSIVAIDQSITANDPGAGVSEDLSGLLQTDAPLQPGDSGGPLVNGQGQVIGMDTAASIQLGPAKAAGFAIPINTALALAARIQSGQINSSAPGTSSGFLGVSVESISDATRAAAGRYVLPVASGAFVSQVTPGSPAQEAGMVPGDIVESLDGTAVGSPSALTAAVHGHHAGDVVQLGWVSLGGRQFSAPVRLAPAPPN